MKGNEFGHRPTQEVDGIEYLGDELAALNAKYRRVALLAILGLFASLVALGGVIRAGRSTFETILTNQLQIGRPGSTVWAGIRERPAEDSVELVLGSRVARSRLAAGIDERGSPYLVMHDAKGTIRFEVYMDAALGPRLSLFDSGGSRRLGLLVQQDGTPVLAMMDGTGSVRLGAQVLPTGDPRIVLSDKSGSGRLFIEVSTNGAPVVCAMDSGGNCRAQLGIGTEGEGYFSIRDEGGGEQIVIGDDSGAVQTILIRRESNEYIDLLELGRVPGE